MCEPANANGNVTLVKSYDPYGQTLSGNGSDSSNFDFTEPYNEPSALFYWRAAPTHERTLTARRLRRSGLVGLWKNRTDIGDCAEFARRLREQAQRRSR